MEQVSIIIPIYNVEKYLTKCINSVINQTHKNIEIICVNDGSTDNSLEILKDLSQKDSRIKVINKKNGGLSSARNEGLKYVTGKYVYFLDSDDWIEPDTISLLLCKMLSNDVDCVIHNVKTISETDNFKAKAIECQNWFDSKNKPDGIYNLILEINKDIPSVAWNKLYKMEIINKYDCKFPEGLMQEDEAFVWIYMIHCKRYYYLNNQLYNYLIRSNSIMDNINNTIHILDILYIQQIIYEVILKHKKINIYKNALTNNYVNTANELYQRLPQKYKKEALKIIKAYIINFNNSPKIIKLFINLKYKKFIQILNSIFPVKNIISNNSVVNK